MHDFFDESFPSTFGFENEVFGGLEVEIGFSAFSLDEDDFHVEDLRVSCDLAVSENVDAVTQDFEAVVSLAEEFPELDWNLNEFCLLGLEHFLAEWDHFSLVVILLFHSDVVEVQSAWVRTC